MTNLAYSEFEFYNGLLFDYSNDAYPTKLHAWTEDSRFDTPGSTYYGYVFEGPTTVTTTDNSYRLLPRQYFCSKDAFTLAGGRGIIIERVGFRGMNSFGGPVEDWGRLKYIDGCTDSLLVPPVKMGDPCLNALFFPENIDQTAHTHPSMRVGMVIEGSGQCVTPERTYDLVPGKIFIIHPEGTHCFRTAAGAKLTVVAYHPDSDFGPQDEDHPMINRTIVDGVSAAKIAAIRTA
ncbi:MAG: AraC family ligand binding domain-containing protein [Bacteroidota bacterium]